MLAKVNANKKAGETPAFLVFHSLSVSTTAGAFTVIFG
ncbi:MAG: hypothetical protein ACI8YD_002727 [Rheinheimera aquimaris]